MGEALTQTWILAGLKSLWRPASEASHPLRTKKDPGLYYYVPLPTSDFSYYFFLVHISFYHLGLEIYPSFVP